MDTSKNYLKAILKEDDTATRNTYIEIDEKMAAYNLIQYLSSDDCNIQNLCRICLTIDEDMVSLLPTKESELTDMFTSLTSIQVYPDEGLPLQVCLSCKNQVINCYEFKEKCEKSNNTLKSVLKGEFITKVESCDENTLSEIITSEENTYKNEIKDEELHEDIQYLEDVTDITSNDDTLCIVQNVRHNKDRREKEEINITITDSKTLLEEVVLKKQSNGKIQKLYTCKFCPKKYLKAKSLKAHIKQTHGTASYPHSCSQCKESFMSEHDLRLHTALHSKDNIWTCNHCHKEFKARQMLRRHIQRHMESKRFSCETCGKPFVELSALRRHLRVHTGDPIEKKHICHICDKRYSSAALLCAHAARHSGARPCVCAAPSCGKSFASARLLASHRRVHTDRKPYQCLYCDKRFRHESTRNTHHRTHTGEKPYVCSVCGKTFIQNSNLTLHMRTHTGERPYTCVVCDRKFSSGSSLKAHQHTHTGEKPYSCNICGKRFARMDLSAHMRHHTGERPFACSVCPKKFVTASRLRDHCRIHTGEKPFECALCTQKFPTKSHLVKHVKTHQTKNKKIEKRKVVIVQEVDCDQSPIISDKFVFADNSENNGDMKSEENIITANVTISDNFNKDMDIVHEVPLEVTEELVLQDDSDIKTEVLVVDDNENNMDNYQSDNICLTSSGVNFINNDLNYGNDVNLVTVNEGEVSISASSAMLEGTTVKLYQLDQSLVQISSSGGQVTISKITSKMTANF